jgi:hypothetical protein
MVAGKGKMENGNWLAMTWQLPGTLLARRVLELLTLFGNPVEEQKFRLLEWEYLLRWAL